MGSYNDTYCMSDWDINYFLQNPTANKINGLNLENGSSREKSANY